MKLASKNVNRLSIIIIDRAAESMRAADVADSHYGLTCEWKKHERIAAHRFGQLVDLIRVSSTGAIAEAERDENTGEHVRYAYRVALREMRGF